MTIRIAVVTGAAWGGGPLGVMWASIEGTPYLTDRVAFLVSPAGDCSSGHAIILNQGRDVR